VDIHTQHLLPQLEFGQRGQRQLKVLDRRLELLRERNNCLKYIFEFVVRILPTAGYSCFVGNKPEIAGNSLTAGCSCFVGDKPEIAGNPLYPLMAGYS
jgi:hypothetical protein